MHRPETIKADWNIQTENTSADSRILAVPCSSLTWGSRGKRKAPQSIGWWSKVHRLTGDQRCATLRERQAGTLELFEPAPRQHSSSLGKRWEQRQTDVKSPLEVHNPRGLEKERAAEETWIRLSSFHWLKSNKCLKCYGKLKQEKSFVPSNESFSLPHTLLNCKCHLRGTDTTFTSIHRWTEPQTNNKRTFPNSDSHSDLNWMTKSHCSRCINGNKILP